MNRLTLLVLTALFPTCFLSVISTASPMQGSALQKVDPGTVSALSPSRQNKLWLDWFPSTESLGNFGFLGALLDRNVFDHGLGDRGNLIRGYQQQMERCQRLPDNTRYFGQRRVTRQQWCVETARWFLDAFQAESSREKIWERAQRELEWYQSVGKSGQGDVYFTGYYYPEIRVSLKRTGQFRYPIYRLPPPSLRKLSRAQIDRGALKGKGLEWGFAKDPLEPYLMQVQGSGALLFENSQGQIERRLDLRYAGQNGHRYVAMGAVLKARGVDHQYLNVPGFRKYFLQNPEDWNSVSQSNPSYVFFQEAKTGVIGAAGTPLIPRHSIAVDPKFFPMGAMGMIFSARPARAVGEDATQWNPFSQWVIAQDVGGAIKSPARVDVFWGSGDYAEMAAGQTTMAPGELYFFLVK